MSCQVASLPRFSWHPWASIIRQQAENPSVGLSRTFGSLPDHFSATCRSFSTACRFDSSFRDLNSPNLQNTVDPCKFETYGSETQVSGLLLQKTLRLTAAEMFRLLAGSYWRFGGACRRTSAPLPELEAPTGLRKESFFLTVRSRQQIRPRRRRGSKR